ncbi:hypothetical protein [Paenibacillus xylanilyticus]|uniref:Uncharacterized protein n=1 Tax=Paenibacillus xylanilyticus TaxID=248903 RepID=A0A7Y6EW27_9BACL|nr:hypothetical protein [Paenibacillus xylanilyticus]NUU76030.1 hypothetical protein [Paenibacillus xylanilyticus]
MPSLPTSGCKSNIGEQLLELLHCKPDKGDTPQNAGTFLSHNGTGAVYYTLYSVNDYDTVAITLERDAMGDQPRGRMILAAKIKG